jgi:hypothetical protein
MTQTTNSTTTQRSGDREPLDAAAAPHLGIRLVRRNRR